MRGARGAAVVALIAISAVLGAAPEVAARAPARVRLVLQLPAEAGCPGEDAFREAVRSRLGYDPVRAEAAIGAAV
ncbi:MAG: hypothetical protein H6744_19315 [Deltaproteobacteria bacterium]|nr:hypothetical protein [Deltaproteobacteria bacterium]